MRRLFVVVAVLLGLFAFPSLHSEAKSSAQCGRLDLPETGLQGDQPRADQLSGRAMRGYNCGLAVVGHVDLGGQGANMAWVDHCAYIATSGKGVQVVDASNPSAPKLVRTLRGPGSDMTLETIKAIRVGNRAVLVAGRYGPAPIKVPAPLDIYDARDCANPKLATTFTFPENIHNLTFSPDAKRVYATMPVQGLDISDLHHPKYLGNMDKQIPTPAFSDKYGKELAHEVELSSDGRTMYLGGQTPFYSYFTIADITNWPARPPKILSQVEGRGHSISLATINGRRYVVHSEESIVSPLAKSCAPSSANPVAGTAQPWLSDVTDPRHPKMRISQFTLAINDPANCAAQSLSGVNASVHYHDVDNRKHTTFVMASMWSAGLRIIDVRDPKHPKEAAYFNPGAYYGGSDTGMGIALDKAWGHVRYVAKTGQIWVSTESGGFWVLELEPQVRKALGLPKRPSVHPLGAPARPPATVNTFAPAALPVQSRYCLLKNLR